MKWAQQERQPDLFESKEPAISLPRDQVKTLMEMVRALLIEISLTSKVEEAGDDEDHI
jgi:hypothetical protein